MIRHSRFPIALVLLLLSGLAVVIALLWAPSSSQAPLPPPAAPAAAELMAAHELPDRRYTPGVINRDVIQDNIDSTICVPGFTKSIRPPAHYTSRLKREQLDDPNRAYDDRSMRDFEEDHDVPLEVGGNPTDPGNLWPEPLQGEWNAHMKDRLENRMHELVCAHALTLHDGQAAFLGNWMTAYQRYVGPRTR